MDKPGFGRHKITQVRVSLSPESPIHLWWHTQWRKRKAFDVHYAYEVGVICRGSMVRLYRDCEVPMQPGDVWLCGLWEPHGMQIVRTPCETLSFAVLPEMLALSRYPEVPWADWTAPFLAPPARRPKIRPVDVPAVLDLMRYLKRQVRAAGGKPPPMLLRFVLMELLRLLLKDWRGGAAKPKKEEAGNKIGRAVELVFDRKGLVPAAQAAQTCGMSRRAFDRAFPKVMGVTFPVFALRYRLHGAAEQLMATEEPLKAIASRWGFSDASHLLHRFAELFGCTPSEYRNTVRGGTDGLKPRLRRGTALTPTSRRSQAKANASATRGCVSGKTAGYLAARS
jgi:AraC-like DNA-binding protein